MSLACEPRRADHADARALLERYLAELVLVLPDFDPARSVSAEPDEMAPPRGGFLVAYEGGHPVACGGVKRIAEGVGEIKRMFVAPETRGRGVGRRLLAALEEVAAGLGCTTIVLDTARPLAAAQALYRAAGYRDVPPYNDNPFAGAWFEKRIG